MVSTLSRCLRRLGLSIAVVMATALLGGCTRAIVGTMHPVAPGVEPAEPTVVADLVIEPERFPAQYPAAVLEGTEVYRALQEIDGVPGGSVVTPPGCAPPPLAPQHTAAVEGIDSLNASRLIVAVTRPAAPLRARAEQLAACPSFTTVRGEDSPPQAGGAPTSVTVTVLPAPPVDADDSYAVDQTVTSDSGSMRRMLTLVAQIGDVQVVATWLQDGTPETVAPDTQALDTLFTDAVMKVHRVGGR